MARFRTSGKKKNSIIKLKIAVEKIQRSLSLGKKQTPLYNDNEEDVGSTSVPDDVKEGHFAVVAVDGEEPKRFVVPLSFLTHPTFLIHLEQAAEEYGFYHEGALTIPCRPCELERIIAEQQWREEGEIRVGVSWGLCEATVRSY